MLSVVIPAYNESEGIETFHNTLLHPALKSLGEQSEVIYVNDGSRDDTLEKLHAIAKKDKTVRIVDLSRNFGKEIATTAGISEAMGDAIMILDADGQHPPKQIPEFLEKWRAGSQVVVGVRATNQKEGVVKKLGSKVFYKLLNSYSDATMVPRSTDFRLIDREVADEFLKFTERNRITRGLIDWLGYDRDYITFHSPARLAGEATYTFSKLVKLALNSITSLSIKPLFMFGWIGISIIILSIAAGLFILIEQFVMGDPMRLHFSGSAILSIFIAFLVGLILVSQAVFSVYISHIYAQTQARPLFVINHKKSHKLNDEECHQ